LNVSTLLIDTFTKKKIVISEKRVILQSLNNLIFAELERN